MVSALHDGVLTVGEMFSGPGGIGLALNMAKTKLHRFKHVFASDYDDQDSCETYKRNVLRGDQYADEVCLCEDIRKLDLDTLPPVDGFLYGFPCNDFSLVGETAGLNGSYGKLYTYGVKYLEKNQPLFFLAENVSGLKSSNDGKAFKQILHDLNYAGANGYHITAHLYKFEEYGIPQTRHRYILVGIRGDLPYIFKVPAPSFAYKSCREALQNIPAWAKNQEITHQSKTVVERLSYIRSGENCWQAEGRMPPELRLHVSKVRMSNIYRRLDPDKPAYTVTAAGGGGTHLYHWSENRSLTNRERARLQTFPDDFVFCGSKESVRKQIGMAVPPEGACKILEALLNTFEKKKYRFCVANVGVYEAKSL